MLPVAHPERLSPPNPFGIPLRDVGSAQASINVDDSTDLADLLQQQHQQQQEEEEAEEDRSDHNIDPELLALSSPPRQEEIQVIGSDSLNHNPSSQNASWSVHYSTEEGAVENNHNDRNNELDSADFLLLQALTQSVASLQGEDSFAVNDVPKTETVQSPVLKLSTQVENMGAAPSQTTITSREYSEIQNVIDCTASSPSQRSVVDDMEQFTSRQDARRSRGSTQNEDSSFATLDELGYNLLPENYILPLGIDLLGEMTRLWHNLVLAYGHELNRNQIEHDFRLLWWYKWDHPRMIPYTSFQDEGNSLEARYVIPGAFPANPGNDPSRPVVAIVPSVASIEHQRAMECSNINENTTVNPRNQSLPPAHTPEGAPITMYDEPQRSAEANLSTPPSLFIPVSDRVLPNPIANSASQGPGISDENIASQTPSLVADNGSSPPSSRTSADSPYSHRSADSAIRSGTGEPEFPFILPLESTIPSMLYQRRGAPKKVRGAPITLGSILHPHFNSHPETIIRSPESMSSTQQRIVIETRNNLPVIPGLSRPVANMGTNAQIVGNRPSLKRSRSDAFPTAPSNNTKKAAVVKEITTKTSAPQTIAKPSNTPVPQISGGTAQNRSTVPPKNQVTVREPTQPDVVHAQPTLTPSASQKAEEFFSRPLSEIMNSVFANAAEKKSSTHSAKPQSHTQKENPPPPKVSTEKTDAQNQLQLEIIDDEELERELFGDDDDEFDEL